MQPHHLLINNIHQTGHDMSLSCVVLFTGNSVMGWLSNFGAVQWMQMVGILVGIGASCYVMVNQHLSIKWKREQDRRVQREEKQKHLDSGGHQ